MLKQEQNFGGLGNEEKVKMGEVDVKDEERGVEGVEEQEVVLTEEQEKSLKEIKYGLKINCNYVDDIIKIKKSNILPDEIFSSLEIQQLLKKRIYKDLDVDHFTEEISKLREEFNISDEAFREIIKEKINDLLNEDNGNYIYNVVTIKKINKQFANEVIALPEIQDAIINNICKYELNNLQSLKKRYKNYYSELVISKEKLKEPIKKIIIHKVTSNKIGNETADEIKDLFNISNEDFSESESKTLKEKAISLLTSKENIYYADKFINNFDLSNKIELTDDLKKTLKNITIESLDSFRSEKVIPSILKNIDPDDEIISSKEVQNEVKE